MSREESVLQPLLAHLFGPVLARIIADAAQAQESERVVIVGQGEMTGPKSWAVQQEGWEDDHGDVVHDPLPTIDLHSWTSEAAFREQQADGWDVLVAFPPNNPRNQSELQGFLQAAHDTARDRARASLVLPTGLLAGHRSGVRQALLETGSVASLIFPPKDSRSTIPRVHGGVDVAVTQWLPADRTESTEVVAVSSLRDDERRFQVHLSADRPWSVPALDPERAKRIDQWARKGNARRLGEIAGFPRPDAHAGDVSAVLAPQQITKNGIDLDVESPRRQTRSDERLVTLQEGDIVGRTLGNPLWTVVALDELGDGLAAGRHVTVIRAHDLDPKFLVAFLRSDAATWQFEEAAAASTVPRVTVSALRELLVPSLALPDKALTSDDPVARFRAVSSGLADELQSRYSAAFDHPSDPHVGEALADAVGDAAMATELVERVSDPLHRARQFLPHPLARTVRVYENHRRIGSPADVYQDLLRFGETAIILLGAVGLAYRTGHAHQELSAQWSENFERSGVSLGAWLKAANDGAYTARCNEEPLGGLARAMSTKSSLNRLLDQFLEARNEHAHGAGPRSPYEYEQAIFGLEELLHRAVADLAPLARSEWFVVEGLDWSARTGTFTLFGRSLSGDHPDFDNWTSERDRPLESGQVHVRLGSLDLPLGGFCLLRSCSVCLHEELYYPDRLRGSMVRLRSLDRGHQSEMALAETRLPVKD